MKKLLLAATAATLVSGAASATVVTGTNSVDGTFDASSGTRDISFAESGSITDLDVTIHFEKCGNELAQTEGGATCEGAGGDGFSYNREIRFVLTAPDGFTSVILINEDTFSDGAGGEWTIHFDDEALAALGASPVSGDFQPVGSLADFDGLNINGTWSLLVQDTVGADALTFYDYTITADIGVPEPAALGLFGLGLVGLGMARRRKA